MEQSRRHPDAPRQSDGDILSRAGVAALFFILVQWGAGAAQAQVARPEIAFSVSLEGEFILVEAHVDLPVAPSMAWAVLTDYEGYPRFITGMRESRVVSRVPEGVVVDQKGSFGFLFFSQAIEVRALITEYPNNLIVSRTIGGSFRDSLGRYELLPLDGGVRVDYTGRLLPEFSLPPLIGMGIVHYILQRNFTEVVDEILRRDALARQPAKPE